MTGIGVTEDFFLGNRLRIRQPAKGYRAGVDAVLLAAAVRAGADGRCQLLDAGAGVGTAGLCAASRIPELDAVLLERESALVELARANVAVNGFVGRVSVAHAGIGAAVAELEAHGLIDGRFDYVIANPPFHDSAAGTQSQNEMKAASHAMPGQSLDDWIRFMARMSRPGGRAIVIHKAEVLSGLLASFDKRFGAISVLPIAARAGGPAIRVIVEGIKGSRAPLVLKASFVLHGESNAFTEKANAILRHGAALEH